MTSDFARSDLPLPGLDQAPATAGNLEAAVRRTLAALDAQGLLEEVHAARCQLALDLAASVTAGAASRRASAVAMAARELREVLDSLPTPPESDPEGDAWEALVREFAQAGDDGGTPWRS